MHRLITIRFSHYNEKARWALDRFHVPYDERGYLPMVHMLPVLFATRGGGRADRVSTRTSTPVLITDEGQCISDSNDIARYVSDRYGDERSTLYPSDEASELERRFHDGLGPHARRFAYFHAFEDPNVIQAMADRNVSRRQAALFRPLRPVAIGAIRRALAVTDAKVARSLERVREQFDWVGQCLGDHRYLVGDRFSIADLTFAALASPVLLPSPEEGFGAELPRLDEIPPNWASVARELRASAAGQHALRMFAEERGERVRPYRT